MYKHWSTKKIKTLPAAEYKGTFTPEYTHSLQTKERKKKVVTSQNPRYRRMAMSLELCLS